MCPRIDMFALSDELSLEEIIPLILEQGFSRIPVFSEKKDNIKGILYIKDLLPNLKNANFRILTDNEDIQPFQYEWVKGGKRNR